MPLSTTTAVNVVGKWKDNVSSPAEKSFNKIGGAVTKIGIGLAGLAGINSIAQIADDAIKAAVETDNLSKRLGVTTEFLSEVGFGAKQSGVDFNSFGVSVQRALRRLEEAEKGNKALNATLAEMNLVIEDFHGLNPEEKFLLLADALSQVEDEGQQLRNAFAFLDTEGVKMLQLFKDGTDGIEKFRKEARELGASLSGKDAKAINELTANLDKMKVVIEGVVFNGLVELADWFNRNEKDAISLAQSIGSVLVFSMDRLVDVAVVLNNTFKLMAAAILGISSVVFDVTAGIALLTDAVGLTNKEFERWRFEADAARGTAAKLIDEIMEQDTATKDLNKTIANLAGNTASLTQANRDLNDAHDAEKEALEAKAEAREKEIKAAKEWEENLRRQEDLVLNLENTVVSSQKTLLTKQLQYIDDSLQSNRDYYDELTADAEQAFDTISQRLEEIDRLEKSIADDRRSLAEFEREQKIKNFTDEELRLFELAELRQKEQDALRASGEERIRLFEEAIDQARDLLSEVETGSQEEQSLVRKVRDAYKEIIDTKEKLRAENLKEANEVIENSKKIAEEIAQVENAMQPWLDAVKEIKNDLRELEISIDTNEFNRAVLEAERARDDIELLFAEPITQQVFVEVVTSGGGPVDFGENGETGRFDGGEGSGGGEGDSTGGDTNINVGPVTVGGGASEADAVAFVDAIENELNRRANLRGGR